MSTLGKTGELADAAARYAQCLTRLRVVSAQVEQIQARLIAHGSDEASCDCERCRADRLTLYGRLP